MRRVGQNRICTPYMTVYLVIFLPKYRIYTVYTYKWLWPTLHMRHMTGTPLLFARTEVRLSAKFLTHSAKFHTQHNLCVSPDSRFPARAHMNGSRPLK